MRKVSLRFDQRQLGAIGPIDDIEFDPVEKAARWAKRLLAVVHQGLGDNIERVIPRAARRFKIPESVLWSLRYRHPKELATRVYFRIRNAYLKECLRQEARLELDLEITRHLPKTPAREALIAETETLLGQVRAEIEAAR